MSTFLDYVLKSGSPPPRPAKRKVFVSYHHGGDQAWYDYFARTFSATYDILYDNSLERRIDSDDTGYVDRAIRENNIFGTSATIVLCGAETWKRKYVDWEIYATLHYKHALLGVALPSAPRNTIGQVIVPNRLHLNIQSGYAGWMDWTDSPVLIAGQVEGAIALASNTSRISNSEQKMPRNV